MEWITNVIVEVVVHTPDGSPLPPPYRSLDDLAALAALANQLNGVTFFETRG